MNLFQKYKKISEAVNTTMYAAPGTPYTSRVISKGNAHVAKFFKDGVHMKDADYTHSNADDVHEFAKDEMAHRSKVKNESSLDERINMPQGHVESPDPISDDSGKGIGKTKKQMGNRTPLEVIAKILAKG
jgi:hypothetical protein